MKLIQKQVDKLREGKATLVADHSKPEMMQRVLKEAFPKDKYPLRKASKTKFVFSDEDKGNEHYIVDDERLGELILLSDFFEEEEKKMTTHRVKINMPATSEERDEIVKELQAMDFPKELPGELPEYLDIGCIKLSESMFIRLLRMRDVYRDGAFLDHTGRHSRTNGIFSFQDWDTLDIFESNFKEELEQVKDLIS